MKNKYEFTNFHLNLNLILIFIKIALKVGSPFKSLNEHSNIKPDVLVLDFTDFWVWSRVCTRTNPKYKPKNPNSNQNPVFLGSYVCI